MFFSLKPKLFSPLTWWIFISYLLVLGYFNYVDFYNNHFFSTGIHIVIYNFLRVFFIFSLLWLFYATGDRILRLLGQNLYNSSTNLESALLAFFTGVGFLHIILFIMGLLGLYTRLLMGLGTLLIFVISLPQLDKWITFFYTHKKKVYYPGIFLIAIPFFALLLVKGLYPSGGHDYYTHYFHFYRTVTQTGSILPNNVWYQFYYSKGAALFFLSMLLTDPLAPQLASMAMIIAATGIVFSILNRNTRWRMLPWLGVALYLGFLVYTPGPLENLLQGGWGDLEKPHEPAAVLTLAMLWISINLIQTKKHLLWGFSLLFTLSALILVSPAMAFFTGIYLSMIALYFFIKKNKAAFFWSLACVLATGAWLMTIWIINYCCTGLPDDQKLLAFWPIARLDKMRSWGALLEMFLAHWYRTVQVANQLPLNLNILPKLLTYLRFDVWLPLLLCTIFLFTMNLVPHKIRSLTLQSLDKCSLAVSGSFLMMIAFLLLFVGRDQPISLYRFTSFTYAPMLCFCLLLASASIRKEIVGILITILFAGFFYWQLTTPIIKIVTGYYDYSNIHNIFLNSVRFIKGKYSLADAYQNQQGWPGRMPWGGIYPPAKKVWELLPRGTRVWSMNVHTYCMLPDCCLEGFMSYILSPHADSIFYANPSSAKTFLKAEHLNYFFYSRSLSFTDALPWAPLFSPAHIADYLGIAWTDGDNTLLTWKENSSSPITKLWLKQYKETIATSSVVNSFPYEALKIAFNRAHDKNRLAGSQFPWYQTGWK